MGCIRCLHPLVKGRIADGSAGLFPQTFTTPDPPEVTEVSPAPPAVEVHGPEPEPHSPTVLQTLREEPESLVGSPNPDTLNNISPLITEGEVMHATMTDVQKAIEQLGRHDGDGSRSFSFASSRGDGDSTDRDSATDTEGEVDGWHLNARQRLAENSRIVNEESAGPSTPMRLSAPPIEVELSDESDAEDDDPGSRLQDEPPYIRSHPHIPEEEEEDAQPSIKVNPLNRSVELDPGTPVLASDTFIVPSPGTVIDDLPTATIPQKSFLKEQDQGVRAVSPEPHPTPTRSSDSEIKFGQQPEVSPAQIPLPTSPQPVNGISLSSPPSTPPPVVSPVPMFPISRTNTASERVRTPIFQQPGTPASTITSIGIQQALGTPTKPQSPFRPRSSETPLLEKPAPPSKPPAEWTVEEVVDWLKGKGIDQGTCDKFIGTCASFVARFHGADIPPEQDITGDVLLELDLELLKTEIGIVAFGKRKRIANAIAELKNPPTTPEPELTAHPESLFSHSRSISSVQGFSLNSPTFSASAAPASATGSQTLFGFYQSDSPKTVEDAKSLIPDTPRSIRLGRESDSGSVHDSSETLNRASSRSSIIGLGIQLTSKFQASVVRGKSNCRILMLPEFCRKADHRS